MNWPTLAQVEAADRFELWEWLNNLPGTSPVLESNREQQALIRRMCERMRDLSTYEAPKFIAMPETAVEATAKAKPVKKAKPAPEALPEPLALNDFFTGLKAR